MTLMTLNIYYADDKRPNNFYTIPSSCKEKHTKQSSSPALQIRVGQQSITASLWPLIPYIYHAMINVTSSF